jgi:eukaryotic-like serine/threonine-protein kinase
MGEVYKVTDRFEQEALAGAALNHPNLLAFYDVGSDEHCTYVVSELLEGQTLRERPRHGPLPIRKALEYAVQIVNGLAPRTRKVSCIAT